MVGGALAVRCPVLLVSAQELAVLADGGASLVAMLPLAGAPWHDALTEGSAFTSLLGDGYRAPFSLPGPLLPVGGRG